MRSGSFAPSKASQVNIRFEPAPITAPMRSEVRSPIFATAMPPAKAPIMPTQTP